MACLNFAVSLIRTLVLGAVVVVSTVWFAEAQITKLDNTTSTPIPGAGHDYIKTLSETVNPASGSLSLRIEVPMPQGRGISLPFSFSYDSNGTRTLNENPVSGWKTNDGYFSQGGWSYSMPLASASQWSFQNDTGTCLGHIARIHRSLDLDLVLPKLLPLKEDGEIGPSVEDALEDIRFFLRVQ